MEENKYEYTWGMIGGMISVLMVMSALCPAVNDCMFTKKNKGEEMKMVKMQVDGVVDLVVPGRFINIVYDRNGEKYTLELPVENFPEAEEGMDFSIALYGGYVAKRGMHKSHEGHSIANGMNDSNREQLARIDASDGEEHH